MGVNLMNALKKMDLMPKSIKTKILFSFMIAIVIMGSITTYPLISFNAPIQKYNHLLENIITANNIIALSEEIKELNRKLFADLENKELRNEYDTKIITLQTNIKKLKVNLMSPESVNSFFKLDNILKNYIGSSRQTTDISSQMSFNDRNKIYVEDVVKTNTFFSNYLKGIISNEINYSRTIKEELSRTTHRIIFITLIILFAMVVVCGFLGIGITEAISTPIHNIAKLADKVSAGDLTTGEIKIKTKDELYILASSFNRMISNLKEMIAKVNASSSEVMTISEQLFQGATQCSSVSQNIAISIQEVADGADHQVTLSEKSSETIYQMNRIVETISTKSTVAKQSSDDANSATEEGSRSLQQVRNQIDNISQTLSEAKLISNEMMEKSEEIGSLVGDIVSIAEQTNLLPLNAAIEAARAGEQGKGFAVVAQEVLKLAEQSTESAKKITMIIHDIQLVTSKMTESMKKIWMKCKLESKLPKKRMRFSTESALRLIQLIHK
jgi:methyl-accepting chemotaxis protein